MKNVYPVLLFIVLTCTFYLYLSSHTPTNMDERASIVIALGKFPPLADQGQKPRSSKDYISIIDYKKYSTDSIKFNKVFQSTLNDNSNASIYYFALSALIRMVGYNLWWLRLFSIILAGMNLYMVFVLAGKFQGRPFFSWMAMAMTAFNPVFILNAILIRSYMLALLGCLLSIFFLLKLLAEERPYNRNYYFFFLSVLLAAGSHYFTFSILAAEFVFIIWTWGRKIPQRRRFMFGYSALVLIAGLWLYISYLVSWNNLQYLINDNLAIAGIDSGYSLSFKNLVRQWMNISTYFFSFSTDFMGKGRVIIKCITGILFMLVMVRLIKMRGQPRVALLFQLIFFSMIFYSLQSVFEGQFINFIPKYLVFIIPLVILGINTALSGLIDEKPGLNRLFKNSLSNGH